MNTKRFLTTVTLLLVVAFPTLNAQKIADYLSVSGFIDTQYDFESTYRETTNISTFQIRRARLDLKGDINKQTSFRLQTDFASSPKIIDAFIKYKFNKYVSIQVGQFKTPFTLENQYSPLNLESIENAMAITQLAGYKDVSGISSYSGGRDIGVQISGSAFKKDKWDILTYYAGIFNGNGINTKDTNTDKDIAARIELRPIVEALVFSGSIYDGNYVTGGKNADRNRYSAGFEYKDKSLTIRSEYLNGETGTLKSDGFYAVAGYWFNYTCSGMSQKIRPVVRYDFFDNNSDVSNDETSAYMFGFEWWNEQNLKLSANYTLKDQKGYGNLRHNLSVMMSIKF